MIYLPAHSRRAAIRAEMRELRVGRRIPVATLGVGLLALASTLSAFLTLAGL